MMIADAQYITTVLHHHHAHLCKAILTGVLSSDIQYDRKNDQFRFYPYTSLQAVTNCCSMVTFCILFELAVEQQTGGPFAGGSGCWKSSSERCESRGSQTACRAGDYTKHQGYHHRSRLGVLKHTAVPVDCVVASRHLDGPLPLVVRSCRSHGLRFMCSLIAEWCGGGWYSTCVQWIVYILSMLLCLQHVIGY